MAVFSCPSEGNMAMEEEKRIIIGRVGRPKGLQGEVWVIPETDKIDRFQNLSTVWVGDESVTRQLEGVWHNGDRLRLKLAGIDTRGDAEEIRGQWVRIPLSQAIELTSNQFFIHDVVGLEVWSTEGVLLGHVVEILTGSATDVWLVRDDEQGEWLFPALSDVIIDVNPDAKRATVVIPQGLARKPPSRKNRRSR